MSTSIDRRSLVKGGIAAAAMSAAAGANTAFADFEPIPTELPDAEPIAPLDPPAAWDDEADVVVVGMGGGGLAASVYLAEAGVKVISLEKQPDVGGSTQHACGWFTLPGGSKAQDEMGYAYPEHPFDPKKFMRAILPYYQYSVDDELLTQIAVKGGECEDWMIEHGAPLICLGAVYLDARVSNGIQPLGMRYLCQDFKQKAIDAGADLRLSTACDGLVMEDGRIVGVKTKVTSSSKGEERFIKANMGVILCTGSFGMNRDMLAKYCPSAWRGASVGGPVPGAEGECTRMAIGAGADMAGFNSWCCWEAYPDRFRMGDGSFYTFHWDGSVILCRQPWLTIDKLGKRYGYYSQANPMGTPVSFGGDGDYLNAAAQLSRMGGAGYCIFDANWEENVHKLHTQDNPFLDDRTPLTPERIEAAGIDAEEAAKYCSADWRDDVEAALERGEIKRADTLEELAELLGLQPEVVVKAVEDWNATCEKGSDDDMIYPYDPSWLIPIKDAPYYGARISGGVGKTFCGPRVTKNLEVVSTEAKVIPGLYAHFTTAGGICGENCFNGTMFNTSIQGGNALSWISGYICAQSILGELA